jgi:BON domain
MNQRDDHPETDQGERGRGTNGGRDLYPGSHGFDDTTHRAYGSRGQSGRDASYGQAQPPPGQYERDPYAQGPHRPSPYGQDQYGQGQQGPSPYGGSPHADFGPGRYGSAAQGEGSRAPEHWHGALQQSHRPQYGAGQYGGGRDHSRQVDYLYGPQWHGPQRHEPERYGYGYGYGYGGGQGGPPGRGYASGAAELGYGAGEGRYGSEWARTAQYRQGPDPYGPARYGFPQYGQRPYGWPDPNRPGQYGGSQYRHGSPQSYFPRDEYGHEHSSEQLFGRVPFGRDDSPHYFGTGTTGGGGSGFTGGAYGYGGPPERPQLAEMDYSTGYGTTGPGGYNPYGIRNRTFPRGPKGYQRSDERLKEDISERLMEAWHIDSSEVSVDVRGGKVMLDGVVPDRRMKHAIEDLVDACPGVQDIDNRVRVGSAPARVAGAAGTAASVMAQPAVGSPVANRNSSDPK